MFGPLPDSATGAALVLIDYHDRPTKKGAGQDRGLQFCFVFDGSLVLKAIIAGNAGHERAACPILQYSADIFPRNAGHRRKVVLLELLAHENAPAPNILTERRCED